MRFIDLTGRIFGRLTVIKSDSRPKPGQWRWLCKCDCGNTHIVCGCALRNGDVQSCGCLQRELLSKRRKKHGLCKSPEYIVWTNMRRRTTDPKNTYYRYYGGRGIRVCDKWNDFSLFLSDMGNKPSNSHTIERIDSNGNYCPENCVWATSLAQSNNRRNNIRITHGGVTRTSTEWDRHLGFKIKTVYNRLRLGWSNEKAVTTPLMKHY